MAVVSTEVPMDTCVRLTEKEYDDNFSGCEGIFFENGGAQMCAHSQHSKLPEVVAQWCYGVGRDDF